MPTLDVIIINWNAGAQLQACLASLAAATQDDARLARVVVVDNASTDGSLEGLDALPLPLVLLRNDANRGFAAACNQGAAGSTADYLLFLNPDTRVPPDALDRAIRFLERPDHARTGLLGVQLVDEAGTVSRTCARIPGLRHFLAPMVGLDRIAPRRFPGPVRTDWDHRDTREVDHVMGAFYLTRRPVFERLGGFDEGFFVYIEDVDYALRVRQAGLRTFYLADVRVYHKGCGTSDQVRAQRLAYALESRLYFGFKHFSAPAAALHVAATFTVELGARLLFGALRRSGRDVRETLRGYALLRRRLPGLSKAPRTPAGALLPSLRT